MAQMLCGKAEIFLMAASAWGRFLHIYHQHNALNQLRLASGVVDLPGPPCRVIVIHIHSSRPVFWSIKR